jgi:flagellar biogenesis protein FliO
VPLRALKVLVVIMGIMLVVGFAALVVVIAGRVSRGGPASPTSAPLAAASLDLPTGTRIEAIGVGAERLVLAVVLPDGTRELVIVDIASGRRLGSIPLRTAQ